MTRLLDSVCVTRCLGDFSARLWKPWEECSPARMSGRVEMDLTAANRHECVVLWCATRRSEPAMDEEAARVLSHDELARADRFLNETVRAQWIFSRWLLRAILGAYVRCAPRDLLFGVSPLGKPVLAGPPSDVDLRFNLSHSEEVTAIAVHAGHEVGVDVESTWRKLASPWQRIVDHLRDPDATEPLPVDDEESFWRLWTAREAVLKALGTGMRAIPGGVDWQATLHQREASWIRLRTEGALVILGRPPAASSIRCAVAVLQNRPSG